MRFYYSPAGALCEQETALGPWLFFVIIFYTSFLCDVCTNINPLVCLWPSEPDEDNDDDDEVYGLIAYGALGGPSAPSWTDLPPPSLLGKDDEPSTTSPRGSPRKTPVTSPAKSGMPSPAGSPSKVSKVAEDCVVFSCVYNHTDLGPQRRKILYQSNRSLSIHFLCM